ncbi:MAG: surface antigen [Gammaproteobacteria bacterium]
MIHLRRGSLFVHGRAARLLLRLVELNQTRTEGFAFVESTVNNTLIGMSLACALILSGCGDGQIRNQEVGTGVGAVLGGLLGAQVGGGKGQLAAVAAGALLGAYLGGNVGRSMDETDRVETHKTLERTPTGQKSTWQNPDNGNRYDVTPTRTYEDAGRPCREYTTEARIEGKRESVRGTACREPDGSWQAI